MASGVTVMLVAMAILPLMDVIAKHLGQTMASGQVAWSRFLFQSLFLAPFVWRIRSQIEFTQWHLHALRGFFIAIATLCFFTALTRLPVADALAIFFVEPLLLTLLSPLFLDETLGWRRLLAVIVGFAGALIIIKPGAAAFGIYALLPLLAALCFAFYLILTRKLAQQTNPVLIQFYTGLSGVTVMTLALIGGHQFGISILTAAWPDQQQWLFMALLGAIGGGAHLLVVYAFRALNAGTLAPFQYFEIISAVIFGWYFFADVPSSTTWLGIFIIVSSGIYIYWREKQIVSG